MLMQAPAILSISFSGPIRLTEVTLLHDDGNTVDFGFTPSRWSPRQFSWPLPVLADRVVIRLTGSAWANDGHETKGDFSFMLHAGADSRGES